MRGIFILITSDFIIVNTVDSNLKHKLIYRKSINLRKGIWCKNEESKGWYAEILSGYASLYYFGVQFNIDKKNGSLICVSSDTRNLYGAKEGNTKVKLLVRSDVLKGREKYFRRTMSKFLEDDVDLKTEILAGKYFIKDAEYLLHTYNSNRETDMNGNRN